METNSLILNNNPVYRIQESQDGFKNKSVLNNIEKNNIDRGLRNMGFENSFNKKDYLGQLYDTTLNAILLLDENENIVDSNNGFEKIFHYNKEEIVGKHRDEFITPANLTGETSGIINRINQGVQVRKETKRIDRNGRTVDVLVSGNRFILENNKIGIFLVYTDISDQKHIEEQLKTSLIEKETLLREVHHRVKNNLQLISSLLNLQLKSKEEKSVEEMFNECQNRVKAISLIHEKLYQTNQITRIDFDKYIKSLATSLLKSFGITSSRIRITSKAENVFLTMDSAIPCGLIINELVTNSLKHAFKHGMSGEIVVDMKYRQDNKFVLTVKDNGLGLPSTLMVEKPETLGFSLIQSLIRQLDAKLEIEINKGTEFSITFSILNIRGGNN